MERECTPKRKTSSKECPNAKSPPRVLEPKVVTPRNISRTSSSTSLSQSCITETADLGIPSDHTESLQSTPSPSVKEEISSQQSNWSEELAGPGPSNDSRPLNGFSKRSSFESQSTVRYSTPAPVPVKEEILVDNLSQSSEASSGKRLITAVCIDSNQSNDQGELDNGDIDGTNLSEKLVNLREQDNTAEARAARGKHESQYAGLQMGDNSVPPTDNDDNEGIKVENIIETHRPSEEERHLPSVKLEKVASPSKGEGVAKTARMSRPLSRTELQQIEQVRQLQKENEEKKTVRGVGAVKRENLPKSE